MNIHEYQAKELLEEFSVATPAARLRPRRRKRSKSRANSARTISSSRRRSTLAGAGRGRSLTVSKAVCIWCNSPAEAREVAGRMLGQTLVTHQTGAAGRVVNKVLIAESVEIEREIYFAMLLDRATAAPVNRREHRRRRGNRNRGRKIARENHARENRSARRPATFPNAQAGEAAWFQIQADSKRRRSFSARFIAPSSNRIARWWK